jgi:hypothetical protein
MSPRFLAVGLALTVASCGGSDSTAPTLHSVAGTYVAARFLLYSTDTIDVLAANGYFDAVLTAQGRNLTFQYYFPTHPPAVSGYVGQYYVVGDTVLFHTIIPVFANSLTWHYGSDSLTATGTYATDTLVDLALTRIP